MPYNTGEEREKSTMDIRNFRKTSSYRARGGCFEPVHHIRTYTTFLLSQPKYYLLLFN